MVFRNYRKKLYFSFLRLVNEEELLMILRFLYIYNIHCLFNKSSLENSDLCKSALILCKANFYQIILMLNYYYLKEIIF